MPTLTAQDVDPELSFRDATNAETTAPICEQPDTRVAAISRSDVRFRELV